MRRFLLATALAVGCFSEADDSPAGGTDATPCDPGVIRACSCDDGAVGNQVCLDDGSGYDACVCGDATDGMSSTTSSMDTTASSTVSTVTSDPTDASSSGSAADSSGSSDTGTACTHRVFVTSTETDGAIGGLDLADARCQADADSVGLAGTWFAVLSDAGNSAASRFDLCGDVVLANVGDGIPGPRIATAETWWTAQHEAAIDRDAAGVAVTGTVWTGTNTSGSADASTCIDWSTDDAKTGGKFGSVEAMDGAWIDTAVQTCSAPRRLYCIELAS